jgi:multimeric flavodoxin WrbA
MRIISLLGSPHGLKGNTGRLLRLVLDAAEAGGARVEIEVLRGDTVLPCRGCDICHKKGYCAQEDQFEPLRKRIAAADALVLASPNYIFNVSAQLKAFMDRCCGVIHCMSFWGKYGASVVTSGGGDEEPIAEYMNHFLITTGAVPVGTVSAAMSAMPEGGFTDEVKEKAGELGGKLVKGWRASEVPPAVQEQRQKFRERMQTLMTYRGSEWPYEYEYWKERLKTE